MVGAVAQLFFTYEDQRELELPHKDEYQLKRTARLYNENFANVKKLRYITLVVGAIVLPLLALVFVSSSMVGVATFLLVLALLSAFVSELGDRFLFYATVVPLSMAGGFFVGKQR